MSVYEGLYEVQAHEALPEHGPEHGGGLSEAPMAYVQHAGELSSLVAPDDEWEHHRPHHPLAALFPLMEGQAFSDLCADIARHGLIDPIVLYEGKVLDGRNRLRACVEAGIPPVYRGWEGADPLAFVISANLQRRHLSESQRSVVAARLATLPPWRPTGSRSIDLLTQDEAAEKLNVSVPSIKRARKVIDRATPELVAAVEQGAVKVSMAAQLADAEPACQLGVLNKHAIHYSSKTPEHYTPKKVLDAVIACMGAIDLDPCSNEGVPNVPAVTCYTRDDDGLSKTWRGQVFLNPPYGRDIDSWVEKLVEEYRAGNVTEAIALIPARPDTRWFQNFRDFPVCFITGRLTFIGNENAAQFPSALVYLGKRRDRFLEQFRPFGDVWERVNE